MKPGLFPSGWRWVRVGEGIAEAQPGFACGERDPNGVVQLRMNNVDTRGAIVWDKFIRVPANDDLVERFRLVDGDIVFNNTNSTELVGKTALFTGYTELVVYSNHFTRLRVARDQADARYVAPWILLQWRSGVFEAICNRWIGQSAVKSDKLLALEIPLPPLPEQQRIVAILGEKMTVVERARAATEAQVEAANTLPAAYLREIFNSPQAQQWPRRPLSEIAELLPAKSIATAGDAEVRVVTTACLTEAGFDPAGIKTARMWSRNVTDCVINKGEVLIARSNTPELVGRVAMYPGNHGGVVDSDLTIRILPKDAITSAFLSAYLSSLFLGGYWKERAGGASGSMKKITRAQIRGESVPVPPLSEQQAIVDRLIEKIAETANLRSALITQLDAINKLPATLLRRAFSGEL